MKLSLKIHPKIFNPLYWHIKPLLRDESIRYIFVEGGSSAAKTYSICQALTVDMFEHQYSTMVFRRQQIDLKDSVINDFAEIINTFKLSKLFSVQNNVIKMNTGDGSNKIRFRGLDKEERIKGIAKYQVIYNNEWSQFLERHFDQQRKRLRGRPNQKFICDWNPVSSKLWLYENWLDQDQWDELPLYEDGIKYSELNPLYSFKRINRKANAIWIKITYRDNYWIVGHPSGKGGYVDIHTLDDFERDRTYHPNLYRVYANGERGIIRTGGEFWKQFNEMKHVRPLAIDMTEPLHVVIDENVAPYVSIALWQIVERNLRQVDEIPCKSPDNNAVKAARKLVAYLNKIQYEDVVYLYGDMSTRKKNTIDVNNRSFYEKFEGVLKDEGYVITDRVGRSNPRIAISAAFVNDIYEGNTDWSITIADKCKVSIDDYITVKEAPDGTMAKKKVKDEENGTEVELYGHYSDTKRYFITTVLKQEFNIYRQGKRRSGSKAAKTAA